MCALSTSKPIPEKMETRLSLRRLRRIQIIGRTDRFAIRPGLMRSFTSLTCRPHRHFGGVALHNCALRIIGVLRSSAIC